jgi:dienelactone hydrolase
MKIKVCKVMFGAFCAVFAVHAVAGELTAKIGEKFKIVKTDTFAGGERTVFDFNGYEAWVVEPTAPIAEGKPWTWTMQWATAFVPRTPVSKMLAKGWHHVTVNTFKHRMDEEGLKISKAFQDYLVNDLGFAAKTRLIGMSWGGFFSVRYTATYPDAVKSIYLDAPLMSFNSFTKAKGDGPWKNSVPAEGWANDPRMPVNMAAQVAAAKIPVLLLYGGQDQTVDPKDNCELFIPRVKDAGGDIKVVRRYAYGHHPHGVEIDDTSIADFFLKH